MPDWLAYRNGGWLDLRLPGDAGDIPSAVLRRRILEYYAQLKAANGRPPLPFVRELFPAEPSPDAPGEVLPGPAQPDLF